MESNGRSQPEACPGSQTDPIEPDVKVETVTLEACSRRERPDVSPNHGRVVSEGDRNVREMKRTQALGRSGLRGRSERQ